MRVCIPIEFKLQGGGYYFLQSLEAFLVSEGYQVTHQIEDKYDILFTNHWMTPRRAILRAFRFNPNVRLVHRIDGAAQDYGRNPEADYRQREINLLADLTIFQSKYCRFSTREKFPVVVNDGPVIHNPVDTELFNPIGPKHSYKGFRNLIACVTWSTNPMKGASSIYTVASRNRDIGFVLCGQYPDAPNLPNILSSGVLSHKELAVVLRSCNLMLTFSRNEACPNHVLEGLASGLPILYHESGAMQEIVGDCGLPVTEESFASQFARITTQINFYSERSRHRALSLFSPGLIFSLYMNCLIQVMETPPRVPSWRRLALNFSESIEQVLKRQPKH